MTALKMPKAWTTPSQKNVEAKAEKVTAKIDMGQHVVGQGLCPECKTPMEQVVAAGHKVWACVAHRVALPLPNSSAPLGDANANPQP